VADELVLVTRGIDEFLEALERAPEVAEPLLEQAMLRSLLAIEGRVGEYPPATEANRPRAWRGSAYSLATQKRASLNTWYERGYGPKWVRKDGTVNGRQTSEFLGRQSNTKVMPESWYRQTTTSENGVEGVVGTRASYARYVIGREQASFHARRGWVRLEDAVEQSEEDIDAALGEAADALLLALARD
jgi:hypothetical protein